MALGAGSGYITCTIVANMETYQFYSLRCLATGRTEIHDIRDHPVDRWIIPIIVAVFVFGGAILGYLANVWVERKKRRHLADHVNNQ
jgi:hypothetical protein